jgi:hypothetical protein
MYDCETLILQNVFFAVSKYTTDKLQRNASYIGYEINSHLESLTGIQYENNKYNCHYR